LIAALVITVIKAERIIGLFPSSGDREGGLGMARRRGNRPASELNQ
jgi:hypothetical protein